VERDGRWLGGLFDRGSWIEAQAGWARTVVTGRARLAGIPCGVIGVETATVMLSLPADPGMPESSEQTIPQAGQVRVRVGRRGPSASVDAADSALVTLSSPLRPLVTPMHRTPQVWYPDSAAKTAAAIEEFDREGLPLVVLANWRGFSGGQRDLLEGVLQAGAAIVEHLRRYRR